MGREGKVGTCKDGTGVDRHQLRIRIMLRMYI